MLAPLPNDQELLELVFAQSIAGFFVMLLDEPIDWAGSSNQEALLDHVFQHQRLTKLNTALLLQYGAAPDQLLGRTPAELYSHDIPGGRAAWRELFESGRLHIETDERRLDGTPIRIEGDYICLYDKDRILGHFGVQFDVTDRFRQAGALAESEAKYQAAFQLSPFRLTINRLSDGRFIEVNEAFLQDLGRTRAEVLGKTSVELGLWADPKLRDEYAARLAREGVIRDLEFPGYMKDGRRQITQLSSALIEIQGEPCVLTVAHDVTERRLAEEAAEQSRQQLRALASRQQTAREEERKSIAREIHDELGQALTALRIDLAWLRSRIGARNPEATERLGSALERIDGTLNAVRRIATELRPSVLDNLGLAAAIEWQALEFQRRTGIRVVLRPSAEDVAVDPGQATTVFRILQESLTNVARHAAARRVEIRFAADGDTLRLRVEDDGRGITPAELADSRSLGLLGMRERASAGGGSLEIEAVRGGGTALILELPRGTGPS